MANMTLSGYLASATAVVFSGTQQINSLTNDEWTDLSDEIDNSTNKYAYADLELVLGSAAFTGADSAIEVYLIPSIDGTNYPDWTGNTTSDAPEQAHYLVAVLPLTAATAARRVATPPEDPVRLPNGKYKYGIRSRANVSLAASGNTLSWRPHSVAI